MLKVIFMATSLVASGSALADWVKVNTGNSGSVTVYADFTKRDQNQDGSRIKLWDLIDYKTPPAGKLLSVKRQVEYDCKNVQMRVFYATAYSGNMATGQSETNTSPDIWTPVPPGSLGENLWRIACRK